jgi:hypothetical protein
LEELSTACLADLKGRLRGLWGAGGEVATGGCIVAAEELLIPAQY